MSTSWLPADSRMLPPSASLWSKHRSFTRWSQEFGMCFFFGGDFFPTMKMPGKNWIWKVPLLLEIHPIFPLNHDYGRKMEEGVWSFIWKMLGWCAPRYSPAAVLVSHAFVWCLDSCIICNLLNLQDSKHSQVETSGLTCFNRSDNSTHCVSRVAFYRSTGSAAEDGTLDCHQGGPCSEDHDHCGAFGNRALNRSQADTHTHNQTEWKMIKDQASPCSAFHFGNVSF